MIFLRSQEQLWEHFVKNLSRSIQLGNISLTSIIVDNLKSIVANLLESREMIKDETSDDLAELIETVQIDLFELDYILKSLNIATSQKQHTVLDDFL